MPESNSVLESQHWINGLLSSIEMGIIIVDANFKVEVWNRFMENHSQIKTEDIVGATLFDRFPEIQPDWLKQKCQPAFSLATSVFNIWEQRPYLFKFEPARNFTSDTDFMYQNITITPIKNGAGDVIKLCFLVLDVTDQALNKIRLDSVNSELKTVSRIDGLTGLYNRRYWQERFDRESTLSLRNKSCHCLLMIDIDHFKKINDNYGHQTGDQVIIHIAEVINLATRKTDIPGRYGGEEFVVLLTDTTAEYAAKVAERIRKAVSQSIVKYEGLEVKYTCSIGVAQHRASYKRAQMWLEVADQALYKAKNEGRNRVIIGQADTE